MTPMTVTAVPGPAGPPATRPPTLELRGPSSTPLALAREVWRSRALVVLLARREFHTRYRRASFGVLWALLLPLVQSVVMAAVLGRFITVQHGVDYPAFVFTGVVAWTFFSTAMSAGSTAIVDSVNLASRVYFPRVVLPIVQVLQNLYAFSITVVIMVVLLPAFGARFRLEELLILPGMVLLVLLAAGFSFIFSALHVYFRDIRYLVGAAVLVWFYATPIIYSASAPQVARIRFVLDVNPVSGAVDLFRAATVGNTPLLVPLTISVLWVVALLVTGIALQSRFNRAFTDLL
jgi:lipopolysaccharide transport system permease protein